METKCVKVILANTSLYCPLSKCQTLCKVFYMAHLINPYSNIMRQMLYLFNK